ncbi:uncharacterized protein EI90DRAFT_2332073 [Cantharellus anzutake]|uniref:uncharacterized protein n=1 Tax=Cantharellus anzutake TaxID=1750568 RepID=UPI001906AFA2|nr:uncharacterized protein EI90DRAFT_2332073 [Cantharellus anzutake]KAF8324426.1 hypothetical protein EI90DRAFT_2332073 [Cantharellus anzutake]
MALLTVSNLHSHTSPPLEHYYSLQGLSTFPYRIMNPPDPGAPRIRSYRDILLGKHSPPLSSTDFENFLTYVEADDPQGGVQNLYFVLWLNQYAKQYNAWASTLSRTAVASSVTNTNRTGRTDRSNDTMSAGRSHFSSVTESSSRPNRWSGAAPGGTSLTRSDGGSGMRNPAVKFEMGERPLKEISEEVEMDDLVGATHLKQRPPQHLRSATAKIREECDAELGNPIRAKTSATPSKTLAYSWFRAKRVFFLPRVAEGSHFTPATNPVYRSHLRLKVHPELLYPLIADEVDGGDGGRMRGHVHPSPARFELIKKEVEKQLEKSLERFIDVSFTNTGNFRGAFGASLSALWIVAAFMFLLGYLVWGKGFSYQLAALACFWWGVWGVCVCMNGICFCLFLFGHARQFFPWEIEQCKVPVPGHPLTTNNSETKAQENGEDDALATRVDMIQAADASGTLVPLTIPSRFGRIFARDVPGHEGGKSGGLLCAAVGAVSGARDVQDDEEAQLRLERKREAEEAKEDAERKAELQRIKEHLHALDWTRSRDSDLGSHDEPSSGTEDADGRRSTKRLDRIHISESYSEDFSPPQSPVQVSIDGGSSTEEKIKESGECRTGEDIHIGMEDLQERNEIGSQSCVHSIPSSGVGVFARDEMSVGWPGSLIETSSRKYPTALPSTVTRASRQELIRSSQRPHFAGGNTTVTVPIDTVEPQLLPHDHARVGLKVDKGRKDWRENRKREKTIVDLPFSFESLPTQPPPKHLIRSRRAIHFTAPMTSVQQVSESGLCSSLALSSLTLPLKCPLVVRAHWEIIMRSFIWSFAISFVAEAICLAFVLPLHG